MSVNEGKVVSHDVVNGAGTSPRALEQAFEKMLGTLKELERAQHRLAHEAQSSAASRRHEELALAVASAYDIIRSLKGKGSNEWIASLADGLAAK